MFEQVRCYVSFVRPASEISVSRSLKCDAYNATYTDDGRRDVAFTSNETCSGTRRCSIVAMVANNTSLVDLL